MGLNTKQCCSATGCNTTRKLNQNLKFHVFPANVQQCWEWVRLSGFLGVFLDENGKPSLQSAKHHCSARSTHVVSSLPNPVVPSESKTVVVVPAASAAECKPSPVSFSESLVTPSPVVASKTNPVITSQSVSPAAPSAECEPPPEPCLVSKCSGTNKRDSSVLSTIENIPKRRCLDFSALSTPGDNAAAGPSSLRPPSSGPTDAAVPASTPIPSVTPRPSRLLFSDDSSMDVSVASSTPSTKISRPPFKSFASSKLGCKSSATKYNTVLSSSMLTS
ncbi:THAP domain-containing protein 2 [Frankliniella fusca]|uniref:THAP domain-containing protein 2 n=1 Tax=Frankliniella fusca TaxID=407009 RepID=A0AAE1HEJ2_9NEOP|nr:THAP domain-containing protein 2 [Frankliniella fusca]